MIKFRPSIFLGAKEDQQAPEESISWMNNINNNNSSSSNNNNNNNSNKNDRAKVVDQEESREKPHSSMPLGISGSRDLQAEAAVDLGMPWAGKSSATPSSPLPNWQFSIHKLPNQDSEVGRPTFSLPGPETRPRMRICFDPEHEIPKLQQWFQLNNHPSRLQVKTNSRAKVLCSVQVEEYVAILNSLDSRRGKKPLDVNNVIYWFKNTRAAVKRAQVG